MGEEGNNLPPGFRFFPSDEELVIHFLYRKAAADRSQPDFIPTLDLCQYDPWELRGKALQGGDKWYFFARMTQDRASSNGYWNPIGADEPVTSHDNLVGMKKTLVYYIGGAPQGIRTNWMMHEYHLLDGVTRTSSNSSSSSSGSRRPSKKRGNPRIEINKWVICRVYESSCGSQGNSYDDGTELSCLDEVFLSLDDYDEISNCQIR